MAVLVVLLVLELVAVDTLVGRAGGIRSPVDSVLVVAATVCVEVDSITVELTVTVMVKTRIPTHEISISPAAGGSLS